MSQRARQTLILDIMKKIYQSVTREYEVSNECADIVGRQVSVTEMLNGEVLSRILMPTDSFPEYINRKKCIIHTEEIGTPDLNLI